MVQDLSLGDTVYTQVLELPAHSLETSPCPIGHPSRQVLQRGEPPQRTGSPY
jgi:hypothetical protein